MERLDHTLAKLLLQVPAVIRNVQHGGDPTRVLDCGQRAAATVAGGFVGIVTRPLLQRHTDDLVALRLQQRGGDRRIDPAGHRDGDSHDLLATMCCASNSASSPTP